MPVTVTKLYPGIASPVVDTYADGTDVEVDERGQLTVLAGERGIAGYADGQWLSWTASAN